MAATALTATEIGKTAATLAASPGVAANATDGNLVPNNGNTILLMNNTGGSTYAVTVAFADTVDGQVVTPLSYSVPANTIHMVKLGAPSIYGTTTLVTAANVAVKLLALQ